MASLFDAETTGDSRYISRLITHSPYVTAAYAAVLMNIKLHLPNTTNTFSENYQGTFELFVPIHVTEVVRAKYPASKGFVMCDPYTLLKI